MKSRGIILVICLVMISYSIVQCYVNPLSDDNSYKIVNYQDEIDSEIYTTTTCYPLRGDFPINQTVSGPEYPAWMHYEAWELYLSSDVLKVVCEMECSSNFTLRFWGNEPIVESTFPEADNLTIIDPLAGTYFAEVWWGRYVGTYNLTIFVFYGNDITTTYATSNSTTVLTNTTLQSSLTPSTTTVQTSSNSTSPPTINDGSVWESVGMIITVSSFGVIIVILVLFMKNRRQ